MNIGFSDGTVNANHTALFNPFILCVQQQKAIDLFPGASINALDAGLET